jgi:hypothetical protein
MGGVLGGLLTGVFADSYTISMSGDNTLEGGWVNRNVLFILIFIFIFTIIFY